MELIDVLEGAASMCSDRLMPQIGPNHQVAMPPLKQSARIASLEYISRDQWYACGLPVPIMYIAAPPPFPATRKCSSSGDQDKSFSLASTSNSRTNNAAPQPPQQKIPSPEEAAASKDANSCASSTKETCHAWKKEESSALTLVVDAFLQASQSSEEKLDKLQVVMMEDVVPGVSGQSELKSSITSVVQGSSIIIRKKKKRRSCWQTLRRKGTNKKARTEKGRKDKRWSGSVSLHSEVGEASGGGQQEGSAVAGGESGSRIILPGGGPDSWSEDEVAAFTLALYLFDKDFCAINRFLDSKKMKDISHFYYGKFYGTPAFCRWAGSKNSRSRKCVHGPRILQGWRQDELLKRLLPHFPDSSKPGVSEAVKSFNERELTVEGLAAELKAAVGVEVLVHCVAIGVPKRDLTAVHGDPAKHGYHPGAGRLQSCTATAAAAAAGSKACSSLSKEEILECLTGDFRISKTRAHDLFWEAVWPRLLDLDWHSMECEMLGLPGLKSPLVFLRPGVTKIGRGSSERGVHYFDSVSEVLKAVANDPGLLDGAELSGGDTQEGSEIQEDEEDGEGWSDDMFETLDMHRLRGPRALKREAIVKNEEAVFKTVSSSSPSEEHAAQDSSESSSVDIDLNRPLSAVSSKLQTDEELSEELVEVEDVEPRLVASPQAGATHHHRFTIKEIDLNLPPLDLDCNSPLLQTEDDGEVELELQQSRSAIVTREDYQVLECKTWDPRPVVMHSFIAASVEGGSPCVMGTFNLNDPLPAAEMMMMDEGEQYATHSAGVPSICPVGAEVVAVDEHHGRDASYRAQLLHKAASCTCGFTNSCKCQSRKRSLSYPESETASQGVYSGKDLISVPKKRAIRFELPVRLNGVHTPNFIFSMHVDAVRRMNSWSKLGTPRASELRQDWHLRASPCMLPLHCQEKFVDNTEWQLPKCKVVEVDDGMEAVNTETEAENHGSKGHVQKTVSPFRPLAGQFGNVKRLRCHLSETQPAVSSSFSRSRLRRLPRKYSISFDSRSSKNRTLKAKERCADWSWPQNGRSNRTVETLNCCSSRHCIPATVLEESQQTDRVNSAVLDNVLHCTGHDDCVPQRKPGGLGSLRESASGGLTTEESVTQEMDEAKSLLRDLKVPCLTLPSRGDSCGLHEMPPQLPRARGIRSGGRSHSQSLPVKSIDSVFLNFDMRAKRSPIDLQESEITKRAKVDTSYSLRSREMTEEDILITLCSMQEQKLEGGITSSEVSPKVKGKRSLRVRRRNFSFKQFIFDGHEEDVEEGLFVEPCTSQGPWQPNCHLPSTEKIARSPKLRRRRSGLPCKSSCVTAGTVVVPGPKGGGITSKWPEEGSRVPVHDVRFSLRRALSEGSVKTDRQSGRKVPARWNQFPVC